MRVAVVGAGNVGSALAFLLKNAGHEIVGIASRTEASASRAALALSVPYGTDPVKFTRQSDFIFLTTPDRAIAEVCRETAEMNGFSPNSIVAHASGAHSSEILADAAKCGAYTISFHPLQTFAGPEAGIRNLPGSYITIEGHSEALPAARKLAADLKCQALEIPTAGKPLYHAAACVACNYFTTLTDAALDLMEAAGVDKNEAMSALYPLIEGTLKNMKLMGTTRALTGPIARGDAATVGTHLESMEKYLPRVIPLYRLLGRATVDVATRKGTLNVSEREQLINLFGGNEN